MNAKQWRALGYKTIFRNQRVYLVRPATGVVIWTPVQSGLWMEFDNVNAPPWTVERFGLPGLSAELEAQLIDAMTACYCDQGVDLCDFCGNIRRAPERARP